MIKFVLQKIRQKRWMFLSLILGNLLMIAVAVAVPMYSQAVLQRALTQNLGSIWQTGEYPGTIQVRNLPYREFSMAKLDSYSATVDEMVRELGIEPMHYVVRYGIDELGAVPVDSPDGQSGRLTLQLAAYTGARDHIRVLHGQMYAGELGQDNTIDVMVSQRTFMEQKLMLGQVLELTGLKDAQDRCYRVRIVGIVDNVEAQDLYWPGDPNQWTDVCLMDEELFRSLFSNYNRNGDTPFGQWHIVLDYTALQADRVPQMLQTVSRYAAHFDQTKQFRPMSVNFRQTMEDFQDQSRRFETTVLVLQIPILLLLAVFIFMVSKQMLELEQNEIAVFKSRGASRWQILRLYIQQTLIVAVLSMALGIPLGVLLCKMLGGTNDFLLFVRRSALPVKFTPVQLVYACAGALISGCATVLPVIRYCRGSIVAHKRRKNRRRKAPWWKLLCLDLVALAVALYGLHQFRQQEKFLSQQVSSGAQLDPMLYLYSSLFMLGAALLFLRLLPLVIRGVFQLGKRLWSPGAYASFLRIVRVEDNQGFLVVFLVLTITMGMFSAQMARSINTNSEEKLRYSIGADLVVQEVWNGENEPDFGKYMSMEGIDQATKVLVDPDTVIAGSGGAIHNVTLMGIHTKQFGQVAQLKDGLLQQHWFHYLNTMSQNSESVLVSSNLAELYGLRIGDTVRYTDSAKRTAQGVICGFVDYWPGYAAVTETLGSDGLYAQTDRFLVVAHLSHLQAAWGVTPYQVWMRTGDASALYDYAGEHRLRFSTFRDLNAELAEQKNDPVLQSTNGILTIGFILVLLLCATGFLIYWILSIRQRTLQFGIFRAMGMSGREVIFMLLIEQLMVSVTSIGAGVLVGRLAARLYVPLVQVAYAGSDKLIPLQIVGSGSDYLRLGCVVGAIVVLCVVILSVLISRIRISQALKLGED